MAPAFGWRHSSFTTMNRFFMYLVENKENTNTESINDESQDGNEENMIRKNVNEKSNKWNSKLEAPMPEREGEDVGDKN